MQSSVSKLTTNGMTLPNYGERLRIGMILPNRNVVAEPDACALLPTGVSIHTTRLRLHGTTSDDLLGMSEGAQAAAELLGAAPLGLIVFHCTAVSTSDPGIGDRLVEKIESASGIPAFATSQALIAALSALGARRVVMLTPYPQAVNDAEVKFFRHYGVDVIRELGLNLPSHVSTASVTPAQWFDKMMALKHPNADAYFLSCTNVRALPVIQALEDALHAPVITSNQAMLWHCLRQSNIHDSVPGYGILVESY